MAMQPRLPARFPVGTRYIVEGEPAKGGKLRIVSRYLVMPSGVRYDLMNAAEPVRKPDLARKPRLRSAQRCAGSLRGSRLPLGPPTSLQPEIASWASHYRCGRSR